MDLTWRKMAKKWLKTVKNGCFWHIFDDFCEFLD